MAENAREAEAMFPALPSIREIATSLTSSIVAVVEVDGWVSVWDLNSSRKLTSFESDWDIGGRRLAISEDGKLCCVGAYEKYGVTLHESSGGKRLWQRKNLKKVQNLRFSLYRSAVLAGVDQRAFHTMDALTGNDLETLQRVGDVWESPFGRHILLGKKPGPYEVLDFDSREKRISIKQTTFAILDACFTESQVAISEAAGPTSLYSLDSGLLLWRYSDPEHRNGKLAYFPQTREIMALSAGLTKGHGGSIIALNADSGKVTRKIPRDDLTIASFAQGGSRVVTWLGNVVDVISGEVISRLDFSSGKTPSA